jgi:hypothetical protein
LTAHAPPPEDHPVTPPPTILALDFDGVLCEGMREYFESSRRTYQRMWPEGPPVTAEFFARFSDLRAVIETGWEMPLLLRALALAIPEALLAREWTAAREDVLAGAGAARGAVVDRLRATLDDVRRAWIDQDPSDWLGHHALYCPAEDLRRVVAAPERTVIVTTKEGEFVRRLLGHWGIPVAGVYGKEAGTHKCDNLVQLLESAAGRGPGAVVGSGRRGRRSIDGGSGAHPTMWFIEDRLETLACVRRCAVGRPLLDAVRLFLATWGYNTPVSRETARADPLITLLTLEEFRAGLGAWIQT